MIGFLVLTIIIMIIMAIVTALMGLVVAILALFKEVTQDCIKLPGTDTCKCIHSGTTFEMKGISGDCSVISDIHGLGTGILAMMIIGVLVCFAGSILGCVAVCCNKVFYLVNTVSNVFFFFQPEVLLDKKHPCKKIFFVNDKIFDRYL